MCGRSQDARVPPSGVQAGCYVGRCVLGAEAQTTGQAPGRQRHGGRARHVQSSEPYRRVLRVLAIESSCALLSLCLTSHRPATKMPRARAASTRNRPAPRLGGPGAPAVTRPRRCKKPCHPPQLHPRVSYNPHPCSRSASNGDELGEVEEELITVHDVVRVLGCPQHLCREQIVVNAHGRCEVL